MTWFPVHCTSINNTNDLISGDNKGVASQFLEAWAAAGAGGQGAGGGNATCPPVRADFVAAFGQSNVGDTSPNILGAFCQDTGGRRFPPLLRRTGCCHIAPSAQTSDCVCWYNVLRIQNPCLGTLDEVRIVPDTQLSGLR